MGKAYAALFMTLVIQRAPLTVIYFLAAVCPSLAQPKVFTENISFYNNGKPKEVSLKNEDLEVIGYRVLNPIGTVLYQLMANSQTGNIDVTKGPVKAIVGFGLTCTSCEWTPVEPTSDYVEYITSFNGKFNEGRPVGPVKVYKVSEPYRSQAAPAEAWISELSPGLRMQFSSFLATTRYTRDLKMTLYYNAKGNLEGPQKINPLTSLHFKDGVLMGFVVRNESNPAIVRDSLFRESKIWKVNNRYQRNAGFLSKLEWNEFDKPWEFEFEPVDLSQNYSYDNSPYNDFVFFGSEASTLPEALSEAALNVGYVYGGNWKDANYVKFRMYANGTNGTWHYRRSESSFVYEHQVGYSGEEFDEGGPLVQLLEILTSSRFRPSGAFPLPHNESNVIYSALVNEVLEDLGYFEYVRKKRAGVNLTSEYHALLIALFDRVCSESPLAYDLECSNGVYVWDYITWLNEFFNSSLVPLRGLYIINDEGQFINYAAPAIARKFVDLANSRR